MRFPKSILLSLSGFALLHFAAPAQATILTFSITDTGAYPVSEDFPEGFQIDQTYGDNVTSNSTTSGTVTFGYGEGGEGFTPNVQVHYGPTSIYTGGPSLWRYDFGDLDRVLYQGSSFVNDPQQLGNNYDFLQIILRADPGFEAVLYGFDLGGWNQTDYVVDGVSVYDNEYNGSDPTLNRVFHEANATVAGAGLSHSGYSFGTPIRGNVITIFIASQNLGDLSEYVGIDNIRFGQDIDLTPEVPEPATLPLFAAATLALALWRKR